MSKFTDLVKKTIPSKWVSFIGHTKDWFDRLPELPEAYFHPIRRDTIQKYRLSRIYIKVNVVSLLVMVQA